MNYSTYRSGAMEEWFLKQPCDSIACQRAQQPSESILPGQGMHIQLASVDCLQVSASMQQSKSVILDNGHEIHTQPIRISWLLVLYSYSSYSMNQGRFNLYT